jgi:polyketide biosynthesis enoyl-CoA hydratase PksH
MTMPPIDVAWAPDQCRIRFSRPQSGNAIDATLVSALEETLARCEDPSSSVKMLVIEGSGETFCSGGDLNATAANQLLDPVRLYDLWRRLRNGPFVSIAAVSGRANAGGIGFIAASDIAIATEASSFALSEMLLGLYPACVLPFLVSRVGPQPAHVMTLNARPITAAEALRHGLIDSIESDLEDALRRLALRFRHHARPTLARYKDYRRHQSWDVVEAARDRAIAANREIFADPAVRANVSRYVATGRFPWEADD